MRSNEVAVVYQRATGERNSMDDLSMKRIFYIRDIINLFVISGLIVLTILMWNDIKSLNDKSSAWFIPLAYSTQFYLVADSIFMLALPACVGKRSRLITLVLHHTATMILVLHPLLYPEHQHFLVYGMVVELNTFCLMAFKLVKYDIFKWLHLITWISLRLCWYPFLIFLYHSEMSRQSENGSFYSFYEYASVVFPQIILVALGLFWTFELVAFFKRTEMLAQEKKD